MMGRLSALLLLLVITVGSAGGEPLYPLLSTKAVDSLQALLRRSRPDTNRVNWLLLLSDDFITRYEELGEDLDSADAYASQAERLSASLHFIDGQIHSQCTAGRLLGIHGKSKEAEQQIRNVLQFYKNRGLRQQQAATWYYLGQVYALSKEGLPRKISCYEQSKAIFRQMGRVDKEAYMLKMIADMHAWQGNMALAQRELLRVLALYQSIHYPKLHYTYDLISSVYHNMSNYEEALKYALLALESTTASKDSTAIGSFYLKIGVLYDELKQWKPAITYYEKALGHFGQSHNTLMVHVVANSVCSNIAAHISPEKALAFYQQLSRQYASDNEEVEFMNCETLAECHLALKHFSTAERYYLRMLAIGARSSVVDNSAIASYIKVGTFYVTVKKYDKARPYLMQALASLKQAGYSRGTLSIHLQLFKADSAQGNYQSAISHYEQYKSLSDSIFNEKKSKQIASLEIQYETKKKEQDIALLTRQNLVQQASIQQKDFQRNSIFAGAILLAGLLGVSYNRYQLKQRSNRRLEDKQIEINQKNESLEQVVSEKEELLLEKEWMLKEIHHRVKNNLQVITSMLNTQSDFLQDPTALVAIRESQNRVHAMALIHQKLYQSDNMAQVNMQAYIHEIVEHLLESFNHPPAVQEKLDVSALQLDITMATPIGLIINEAVTNSLKYAFPQHRPGTIAVGLQPVDEQTYRLTVRDDGIGMPAELDFEHSDTLGLTMIHGLSRQIGGQLRISQDAGVHICLEFRPVKKSTKSAWLPA